MTPTDTQAHRPLKPRPEDERPQRATGGPEDLASYECGCRLVFKAPATTTVHCPRCGAAQSW